MSAPQAQSNVLHDSTLVHTEHRICRSTRWVTPTVTDWRQSVTLVVDALLGQVDVDVDDVHCGGADECAGQARATGVTPLATRVALYGSQPSSTSGTGSTALVTSTVCPDVMASSIAIMVSRMW